MRIYHYCILLGLIGIVVICICLNSSKCKFSCSQSENNSTFSLNRNDGLKKYYYKYEYIGKFFIPKMGEDNYYTFDIRDIVKKNGLNGRIISSLPYDENRIIFLFERYQENNGEDEMIAYMVDKNNYELKIIFTEKLYDYSGYRISEGILYQHSRIINKGVKIVTYDIASGEKTFEKNGKILDCVRRKNYWYYKKEDLLFVNCGPIDASAKKNPEKDETFRIVDLSSGNMLFEKSGNIIWSDSFVDPENVLYTYEGILYSYNALRDEDHEIKLDVSEGVRMRKDTLIDKIHFVDNQIILVRNTRKKDWGAHFLFGAGYDYKWYYYLGEYVSSDTILIKEQLKGKPFIKNWHISDIEAME